MQFLFELLVESLTKLLISKLDVLVLALEPSSACNGSTIIAILNINVINPKVNFIFATEVLFTFSEAKIIKKRTKN